MVKLMGYIVIGGFVIVLMAYASDVLIGLLLLLFFGKCFHVIYQSLTGL